MKKFLGIIHWFLIMLIFTALIIAVLAHAEIPIAIIIACLGGISFIAIGAAGLALKIQKQESEDI